MSSTAPAPFRFGNVVGRGFATLYGNAVTFATIAVLLMVPYAGVSVLQATGNLARGTIASVFLEVIAGFVLPQLLTAAVVHGTFQDMRGQRAGVSDAVANGFQIILPVVGTGIVTGLGVLLSAAPAFLVAQVNIGGLQVLLALGLLAFPFFVLIVFFVAIPACVIERRGVGHSVRRSVELTKGERWRVLAVMAIVWLVGVGVLLVTTALAYAGTQTGSVLFPPVLLSLAAGFYYALNAVMATVTYHDLRVAKEGVGTDEIARVFD